MRTYVSTQIPQKDIVLFEEVKEAVISAPDIDLGRDCRDKMIRLSCHILSRAVAEVFSLEFCDGFFCSYKHSWVLTSNANIIDVYPIAIYGGPVLIDGHCHLSCMLYQEDMMKVPDSILEQPCYKDAIQKMADALDTV